MAIDEKELICRQLRWVNLYYAEILKLDLTSSGMPAAERQEKLRLRLLVHHHSFLHLHLLWDALILGLACILETPGWDQRASVSKKITLKHFVQKLKGNQKVKAESLFKEVMSLPSYSELWQARNNIIAHSNREILIDYAELPPEEAFPSLTLDELGELLRRVDEIALLAVDPCMDFSIPGFEGVDELFRVLRRLHRDQPGAAS